MAYYFLIRFNCRAQWMAAVRCIGHIEHDSIGKSINFIGFLVQHNFWIQSIFLYLTNGFHNMALDSTVWNSANQDHRKEVNDN